MYRYMCCGGVDTERHVVFRFNLTKSFLKSIIAFFSLFRGKFKKGSAE